MDELQFARWAAENYGPALAGAGCTLIGMAYALRTLYQENQRLHKLIETMLHERSTLLNTVFDDLRRRLAGS